MKLSELFQEVRQRLVNGKSHYICFAVEELLIGNRPLADEICQIIEDKLHPNSSFEGYMSTHHNDLYRSRDKSDENCFQQYRIDWVDDIIIYFKERESAGLEGFDDTFPGPQLRQHSVE